MKEKVCFIPARGGSKRLKGKNLALFNGKPLVAHTIEQATSSNIFDSIILSSEDEDILSIGRKYGIELHNREKKLSKDNIKIIEVIQELIIKRPISKESVIGLLLVTCPLRSIDDIKNAYELFKKHKYKKTVVSVKKNETPIQLSWKEVDGFLKPVFPEEYKRTTRKQDHYATYCYNDAIIFDSALNYLDHNRNLFGNNPIPYIMPWERSIPIDYEFQLKICQCFGDMEDNDATI